MKTNTQKIIISSMLAALCCVATMLIKIPSPLKGYLNLGDCIVLLAGWLLAPGYAFFSAGVGSALADVLSGYAVYAPATLIIKGAMALIALFCYKKMSNKAGNRFSRVASALFAEIVMVLGYFIFEGFMYGFVPSAVNIPANIIQGVVGLLLATQLIKVFEKTKLF